MLLELTCMSVYDGSSKATGGDETSVAAFISRFYRLLIRSLHANTSSLPPTRQVSPRLDEPTMAPYVNPFQEILNSSACDELLPELRTTDIDPSTFDLFEGMPVGLDSSYWESVFPGFTTDSWSWLEPAAVPAP